MAGFIKKVIKNIKNIDLWNNHFSGYYYYLVEKLHLEDFLGFELIYGCASICASICAYYGAYGYNF